jgi:hypothetical protein
MAATPEKCGELRDSLVKHRETPVYKVETPEKNGEPCSVLRP